MKININQWNRVLQLEKIYLKRNKNLTRNIISDELEVPENTGRFLLSAVKNKDIISKNIPDLKSIKGHTLVLADLHTPFEDKQALDIVITYAKTKKINRVVLLGDLIDFYKISFFRKIPGKGQDPSKEIESGKEILLKLRNSFPNAEFEYVFGNHEERLENYILDEAPQLYNLLKNLLPDKLGLEDLKIKYHLNPIKIGYLWHLHGHEKPKGGGNPEYITNVMWKYIHDNFLCAHWHRQQDKMFSHITRKRFQGTVIGWLGDPFQVDYQKLQNDTQGFALVEYDNIGRFKTYPKKIIEGEVF